jgi:hypothetical protein
LLASAGFPAHTRFHYASRDLFGYFNGSYSEIEVAQATKWTPQNVLDRGLLMLDFLEKRWKIPLKSRGDKLWLLRLEFLEPATRRSPEVDIQEFA